MIMPLLARIVGVVALALLAAPSGAQLVSPLAGDIPRAHRGILGVQLDRDSLLSVQRRLGPAEDWLTGDAGDAHVWWCYRVPQDAGMALVLMSSDGEMGGVGHEVDRIQLSRLAGADTLGARCLGLSGTRPLATPGGLRLGMSRTAITHLLGVPLLARGDSILYAWQSEQRLPRTDPNYARWNARRNQCFGGKAPFTSVGADIVIRFDQMGASEIRLSRSDAATC
jgi:hypothetical protein